MSVPRTRRSRLVLALVALLVAIGLLELAAARVLGPRFQRGTLVGEWQDIVRVDPELGWTGLPGARAVVASRMLRYGLRTNSAGFRDPERRPEKPAGVKRVLLLGDSSTWGMGVGDGERFSDLLEVRFAPGVEVQNLAAPGYATDQEYWLLLERGFACAPDVVFLAVVADDLMEVETELAHGLDKPRYAPDGAGRWTVIGRPVEPPTPRWLLALGVRWRRLVAHSALLSWIRGTRLPPENPLVVRRQLKGPSEQELALVREAGAKLAAPDTLVHWLLGEIAGACREHGVPLVAAVIPHKHDQYLYEPNYPRPDPLPEGERITPLTHGLFAAAEALGFEAVSLDRALLTAVSTGARLHCGDGHLNEAGHRVVAEALEPVLRRALAGR